MSSTSGSVIYPKSCFHLAPTYNTWCLLRAADIHNLEQHAGFEGENFYFYANLPIKWVRIVGVVVAIDEIAGKRFYTVDDSSGACIEAVGAISTTILTAGSLAAIPGLPTTATKVEPPPTKNHDMNIEVGNVVDIKGKLDTFRDERQILIEKMRCLNGTAQEVSLWEKRAAFQQDVLLKPWILQQRDIRKCEKEARQSMKEAEKKRKRLRLVTEGDASRHVSKAAASTRPQDEMTRNDRAMGLKEIVELTSKNGAYSALGL